MKSKCIYIFLITSISISWINLQNPNFLFERGNQKLQLELEDGSTSLKWNEPNKITLKFQNIDPQKLAFSGIGIRPLRNHNTKTQSVIQVTPTKELFKTDTLNLNISARDEKDSIWFHKFSIIIKE